MTTTYDEFIYSKTHSNIDYGIKPLWIPDNMFDFQKFVTEKTILKGRFADFLDTGLGKTFISLVVAANYVRRFNKPVLILTPLAVAFQFLDQAAIFGIDDVSYCKDGKYKTKIVIANYERLHYFNQHDFFCVICDESSILKNEEGQTRNDVNAFMRKIEYRYLFTATPSPNDYTELGTCSEALGYMGYTDMLTMFFKNNEDTISPMGIGVEWVLKGHAQDSFFDWVSTWSLSMRKPSDLGFSDAKHILPPLHTDYHQITNTKFSGKLFNTVARTRKEIAKEVNNTIIERCEKAIELASKHEISVYWCNLNSEGDLLDKLDKEAVQLKGSMDLEQKEEILVAFAKKEIKKLITKPKMTGFGLNWQHCGHTVFFPTFSYEQWYQAVRRFWRFGRVGDVYADVVHSDGQQRIIDGLFAKANKADKLFSKLNTRLNQFNTNKRTLPTTITLPSFI